jgi:hypothetical protein
MTGLRRVADDIALRYVRRKRLIEQAQLLSGEGPDSTKPATLT